MPRTRSLAVPLSRDVRHFDEPRDDGILLRNDLPERIDVALQLRDVPLDRADLVGGVVELLRDGRLCFRVGAARRERQQCDVESTPDDRRGWSGRRAHGFDAERRGVEGSAAVQSKLVTHASAGEAEFHG